MDTGQLTLSVRSRKQALNQFFHAIQTVVLVAVMVSGRCAVVVFDLDFLVAKRYCHRVVA